LRHRYLLSRRWFVKILYIVIMSMATITVIPNDRG